uniref:Uncharacterized protein n=1 Tax=Lactuca sativa TaxID=4236 RepID=A0A9R1VJZ7_LACSA|nr:hypothetical protein LSAT_V11C400191470 [Lactuca sativa]
MSMIEEDKRLELACSPTNTISHHRTSSTTIRFAIGNGLTEPGIQFKADVDFCNSPEFQGTRRVGAQTRRVGSRIWSRVRDWTRRVRIWTRRVRAV